MLTRWIPLAALLFASPALAQSNPDNVAKPKPQPKAARVPSRPKLPTVVRPAIKDDTEPGGGLADRPSVAPTPAQGVTRLATDLGGTYRCTGRFANTEGGLRDTRAKLKVSSDLDGYWIAFDLAEDKGASDFPFRLHIDRTYSEGVRAWQSVALDNRGYLQVMTADRADEAKVTWRGTSHRDGSEIRVRTVEDRDGSSIRLRNELSPDGKTYTLQYDLSCTK